MSDRLIEQKLRSTLSLEQIVDDLTKLTLDGGAPDNVTVLALEVVDADEADLADSDSLPSPRRPWLRPRAPTSGRSMRGRPWRWSSSPW